MPTRAGLKRRLLRNTPDVASALLSIVASDRCLITLNPYYPGATGAWRGWRAMNFIGRASTSAAPIR